MGRALSPLLTERLRAKRRGKAGRSWSVDETYIKVRGRWCYLYRAIDHDGNLIDSLLSETRDLKAAQRFFRGARAVVGQVPDCVTTDGHDACPRDLRGARPRGRPPPRALLTNRLEQDHRGIKQPDYPKRGFGSIQAATRFCTAHDELRDYLQPRQTTGMAVSLAEQRQLFRDRWVALMRLLAA